MVKFGRGVLAVLAGCLVAAVVMGVVEPVGRLVYPLPPDLDLSKPTDLPKIARAMPTGAFAFIIAGWAIGTLIGSSVASKLAPDHRPAHGLAVGGLMMASAVANMVRIPHPTWVWVVGLALFPPMSFVGATLGSVDADRSGLGADPAA